MHGALGACLKNAADPLSAEAFATLYGEQRAVEAGRLWLLRPPLDETESWLEGSRFHCDLVFMGPLIRFHSACSAALETMGRAGAGHGEARFNVLGCESLSTSVREILQQAMPLAKDRVTLQLLSPLRLKQGETLLRGAPSLHLLLQRLFSRLSLLARQAEVDAGFDWKPWLAAADAVVLSQFHLSWMEWHRYSARQQSEMLLGGLRGELDYAGEIAPLLPWLHLMAWLNLGGKTTFGFGQVALRAPPL